MKRKPRDPDGKILPRGRLYWLAFVGLVMGAATIAVIAWADNEYDTTTARTMGMTSFAIANLLYSFAERDERQSMFSLDVLRDRKFLMFSAASALAIILAPELNMLNRFFATVPLSRNQWFICILAALAAPLISEIRKLVLRRREAGERSTTLAAEPAVS